jgi:N-acetylglucosaminyldiphosphoundecaprenol N-acetyl-beta-D-mannosaminyltransferase
LSVDMLARCETPHVRRASRVPVNGVGIDAMPTIDVSGLASEFLRCGKSHIVHFVCAHPTVLARKNAGYRGLMNRGDLNLADGMSVVWALHLMGLQVERSTGADSLELLTAWGVGEGVRHFFYGGAPGVADRLRVEVERAVPGVVVAGTESPPFAWSSAEDLRLAAARIRAQRTDLLWVGLGTPKQDVVAEQLATLGAAPVVLCVGAAFDFVSGAKRRSPAWMQRAGLEWLGRLASEPARLWRRYLIGNAQFAAGVLRDRVRSEIGR